MITAKLGNMILGAALVGVIAAAAVDRISSRATISELRGSVKTLDSKLAASRDDLGTCHGNVAQLSGVVDRQGADIRALTKATVDGDKATARALAALTPVIRAAAANSKAVLELRPPAPALACEEAAKLLMRGAR